MDWSVRDWARRVVGRSKKRGDMTRGKRSGDEDDASADRNEAGAHQGKSSDRGGEDVEEEPQVYREHHTRRAHEQRG